jgi:hypothetical protein
VNSTYIVARFPIPTHLQGSQSGFAIRPLSVEEVIAIEDQFHRQGDEQRIPSGLGTFILPDTPVAPARIPDLITMVEFACCIVAVSGHPSFHSVAILSNGKCSHVLHVPRSSSYSQGISFVSGLTATGLLQWLRRCLQAKANLKDRMHITAHRFIRSARAENSADRIMDLCISLESLLDHQTEVSFRFSISLARVIGTKGAVSQKNAALLADLYEARSKLAHGDPVAGRLVRKLEPRFPEVNALAKQLLTTYVLYVSEHSRGEWKGHIHNCLYS